MHFVHKSCGGNGVGGVRSRLDVAEASQQEARRVLQIAAQHKKSISGVEENRVEPKHVR